MSETIPAELLNEARKVADQLWLSTCEKADAARIIARALLARDERAAKEEREACSALCYERSKEAHRQAKQYEADGDETSQVQALISAVEAIDCASAIRDRSKT